MSEHDRAELRLVWHFYGWLVASILLVCSILFGAFYFYPMPHEERMELSMIWGFSSLLMYPIIIMAFVVAAEIAIWRKTAISK